MDYETTEFGYFFNDPIYSKGWEKLKACSEQ